VTNGTAKKSIAGILLTTLLIISELILSRMYDGKTPSVAEEQFRVDTLIIAAPKTNRVRIAVFGDINLGRKVGQRILKGETGFPFERLELGKESADILFANLESPLSDQNGETVSPLSNIVFTGPPEGAKSLKDAGFTVVSTANNHSLDYGINGLRQTMRFLDEAEILHCGTSMQPESVYVPLFIEKNNIKFVIFAVTTFMNFNPKNWRAYVAADDTVKLSEEIRKVRSNADVILMSVHGGTEYGSTPDRSMREFYAWCARNGVDIVLGHHPHVTYGIEKIGRTIVVQSLGNMIFYQPQHVWTQRSYGVHFVVEKTDTSLSFDIASIIPLRVGFQTERMRDTAEVRRLRMRTQALSNFDISTYWD
jgi:poly-gamma-glutamate capsule biosynthesis protein CapA/YwtB (metallophosphatase superfamily)